VSSTVGFFSYILAFILSYSFFLISDIWLEVPSGCVQLVFFARAIGFTYVVPGLDLIYSIGLIDFGIS
jgi:hypothetical protein